MIVAQPPKIEWRRIPREGFIKTHWIAEPIGRFQFRIWRHQSGGTRFKRGTFSYSLVDLNAPSSHTGHATLAQAKAHATYLARGGE